MVARMTLAATLIMIVGMTFRIPYTWQGAIYALIVSRENTRATPDVRGNNTPGYRYRGDLFLDNRPLGYQCSSASLSLVIGTLFLAFYAVSALTNYTAAVAFINLNAIAVPLWIGTCQPKLMWKTLFGCVWLCWWQ